MLALGLPGLALGPPGFLDTAILVLAMRISCVGCDSNAKPQRETICVAVEEVAENGNWLLKQRNHKQKEEQENEQNENLKEFEKAFEQNLIPNGLT